MSNFSGRLKRFMKSKNKIYKLAVFSKAKLKNLFNIFGTLYGISSSQRKFRRDRDEYIRQCGSSEQFKSYKSNIYPCLEDYKQQAGSVDGHYFYQDIYAANQVLKSGCRHIYDIGSRLDGYIAHLLSMDIKVTMIDVRPLDDKINGLDFIQGDAMRLDKFINQNSIDALSSLHATEHFGLGRYGDPVDYNGWRKALANYKKILKPGGMLFLSVPVGINDKLQFNAHRIFRPYTIANELMPEMQLLNFARISHGIQEFDFKNIDNIKSELNKISDKYLGNYDCGVFIFKKII